MGESDCSKCACAHCLKKKPARGLEGQKSSGTGQFLKRLKKVAQAITEGSHLVVSERANTTT